MAASSPRIPYTSPEIHSDWTNLGHMTVTEPITVARGIPSDPALVRMELVCCDQEEKEWMPGWSNRQQMSTLCVVLTSTEK